jgi:EAL domain-containing protein (putative c-di-GMP-specific phosphodiesterase class I)
MILDIGRIILAKSFSWFATMKQRGVHPGRIAINISPVQMKCARFIGSLRGALEMYGLAPDEVEIEVTETAIIGRDEAIIEKRLKEIANMGLQIALDDFGTGNATFSHLKRFPINRLKIDKSFVADIGRNADDTIITQAIINLAHNLGMEVVAEGIETKEQGSFLHINGCDIAQGYFYSRPLPLAEAENWLKTWRPEPPKRPARTAG